MTAHGYGPLDREPAALRPPLDKRRTPIYDSAGARLDRLHALHEPLAGIVLGDYDRRMLDWLALWDLPTVAVVVSLLHRARAAAPLDQGGAERASTARS